MTSAYLFAFAAFQLPLGVLLDRFGPRRVQAALLGCAALGSLLFALGEDLATLTAARALIGLGFAGGLMSGFKAIVLWIPEPRRPLANAWVMSFGALGILVATLPVELAVAGLRLARGVRRPRRDHRGGRRADPARGAGAGAAPARRKPAGQIAAVVRILRDPSSGGWRRCSPRPPAPTSRSRRCGPGPGCATSPASTGSASPIT